MYLPMRLARPAWRRIPSARQTLLPLTIDSVSSLLGGANCPYAAQHIALQLRQLSKDSDISVNLQSYKLLVDVRCRINKSKPANPPPPRAYCLESKQKATPLLSLFPQFLKPVQLINDYPQCWATTAISVIKNEPKFSFSTLSRWHSIVIGLINICDLLIFFCHADQPSQLSPHHTPKRSQLARCPGDLARVDNRPGHCPTTPRSPPKPTAGAGKSPDGQYRIRTHFTKTRG
jgi:hypothetical protein